MYLNKVQYYFLNIVSFIGIYLWGTLSFCFICAFCITLIQGELDELLKNGDTYLSITVSFCVIFLAHKWLRKSIARVNIYNSLFSNDPDGIIQIQVLERAMGVDHSEILKEIKLLQKLKLLEHCRVETLGEHNARILLTNAALGERMTQDKTVYCRNCGAKNRIRTGFVNSCTYCGSKLDY